MSRLLSTASTLAVLAAFGMMPLGVSTRAAWAQDDLAVGRTAVVANVDSDVLQLRNGAGLSYPVQGTVREGTRVQIVEGPQTADGHTWFRVSAGSASGWASGRYLNAAGDDRATLAAASAARGPLPPSSGRTLQVRVVGYNLGNGSRTASGTTPRFGTVAVDPQVIPLGSRLTIEGFEGTVFVAEDTGSAVRGNMIDIWFEDPVAARRFGTQNRTIIILDR
ncbi:MAG TPA: 3D domain-containing protein [Chloroflexota bacterium]|nr:3D domain-containing protein [Chloroflexota bacterium]